MKSKLDLFKEQALEKQREILVSMLDPFKERSAIFAKTLARVEAATRPEELVPVMERMLQISENVKEKKKEQDLSKMEWYQETIKRIHEKELEETESDLDMILEEQLESV